MPEYTIQNVPNLKRGWILQMVPVTETATTTSDKDQPSSIRLTVDAENDKVSYVKNQRANSALYQLKCPFEFGGETFEMVGIAAGEENTFLYIFPSPTGTNSGTPVYHAQFPNSTTGGETELLNILNQTGDKVGVHSDLSLTLDFKLSTSPSAPLEMSRSELQMCDLKSLDRSSPIKWLVISNPNNSTEVWRIAPAPTVPNDKATNYPEWSNAGAGYRVR